MNVTNLCWSNQNKQGNLNLTWVIFSYFIFLNEGKGKVKQKSVHKENKFSLLFY